ncbi:MAG: Gfo/Idh/MocA family oxidoreductase [Bryobacteraceae bacterium]
MSAISRRDILQAASIVPVAAVRGTAANSAVSVGLIGCGNRGSYLGQLLTEHTQARLTALCDVSPAAIAKARQKIGRTSFTVFDDMEKLLASPVDAVMIATPVFLHPQHFEAAVQAGKHVYLEKPAAADVEGCRRVERVAAGAAAGRDLNFGFQRRYAEVYRKADAFHRANKIGAVRMASVRFIKPQGAGRAAQVPVPKTLDEKVKYWYYWRALSGDLIVENNCHLIDVMNWFVGSRPEAASGAGGRTIPGPGDVRDHGTVSYQYPGGVQGDLCGMVLAPGSYRDVREEFFGAEGWLETSERGWRYGRTSTETLEEKSPRDIAIDSVRAFAERLQSGKAENTIARGVESSLTAILGRLAMDLQKPVTWNQMMASNGWPE